MKTVLEAEDGADDYITKPATPPQWIARVNTALMRRERLMQYFSRNPVTNVETSHYFMQRCRAAKSALNLVVIGIGNYVSLVRGHALWLAESAAHQTSMILRY
ncbi:MAG: hypothetical protein R8M45_08260 [Ghiorsea sp.]